MTLPSIELQLRSYGKDLAEREQTGTLLGPDLSVVARSRPRRRSRLLLVAALLLFIAGVAGLVLRSTATDDPPYVHDPTAEPTTPASPTTLVTTIESATLSAAGNGLAVSFIGRAGGAACGAGYTATGFESPDAVSISVIERPIAAGPDQPVAEACDDIGYRRYAAVALAAPLGNRALIDAASQKPIFVTVLTEPVQPSDNLEVMPVGVPYESPVSGPTKEGGFGVIGTTTCVVERYARGGSGNICSGEHLYDNAAQ